MTISGVVGDAVTGDVVTGDVAAVDHNSEGELLGLVSVRPRESTPRPAPVWESAVVLEHEVIDGHYHRLVLRCPTIASRATAGQFVMITVPEHLGDKILLPRPMAIHRRHRSGDLAGSIEVVFSIVGRGTAALARITEGSTLMLTGALGRGFELPADADSVLLMSHGSGVCAVMGVAEDARDRAIPTVALLSAAMRSAVVGETDCRELGVEAIIVTEDASTPATTNSIPTIDLLLRARFESAPPSVIMVCGSAQLARAAVALGKFWGVAVQVSLEAHMACGLGYCHGCAAPVSTDGDREGPLVCSDGPVFDGNVPMIHPDQTTGLTAS